MHKCVIFAAYKTTKTYRDEQYRNSNFKQREYIQ